MQNVVVFGDSLLANGYREFKNTSNATAPGGLRAGITLLGQIGEGQVADAVSGGTISFDKKYKNLKYVAPGDEWNDKKTFVRHNGLYELQSKNNDKNIIAGIYNSNILDDFSDAVTISGVPGNGYKTTFFTHAMRRKKWPFAHRNIHHCGIGSSSLLDIDGWIDWLYNKKFTNCLFIFQIGTNDVTAASASFFYDLILFVSKIIEFGNKIILVGLPARLQSTGVPLDAFQKNSLEQFFKAVDFLRRNFYENLYYIDLFDDTFVYGATDFSPIANLTYDNIHYTQRYHEQVGEKIVTALNDWGIEDGALMSYGDSANKAGWSSGTAGTLPGGITGQLFTGWSILLGDGSSAVGTCTISNRSGSNRKFATLSLSSATSGYVLVRAPAKSLATLGFVAGDFVEGAVEVETGATTTGLLTAEFQNYWTCSDGDRVYKGNEYLGVNESKNLLESKYRLYKTRPYKIPATVSGNYNPYIFLRHEAGANFNVSIGENTLSLVNDI